MLCRCVEAAQEESAIEQTGIMQRAVQYGEELESLERTYILERNDVRKKNRQYDSDCSRSTVRQLHSLANTPVESADDDFALAIDDQNRGNHGSRRALSPLQNMSLLFRIPPSASFLLLGRSFACSTVGVLKEGWFQEPPLTEMIKTHQQDSTDNTRR